MDPAVSRRFLSFVGWIFVFFSLDEVASIHERITNVALELGFGVLNPVGKHGAWATVYLAIGLGIVVACRRPLLALARGYPRECRTIALGTFVLLIGVVALELSSWLFFRYESRRLFYKLEVAAEEGFEMLGATLMLYGVMLLAGRLCNSDRTGEKR